VTGQRSNQLNYHPPFKGFLNLTIVRSRDFAIC
jgi:hypothetical protein